MTARPRAVAVAGALWFVALVAWDLSALLIVLDLAGEALHTAAVFSLVLSILVTAVLAWVGMQMRGGARWARIVVTVFACVGTVDLVAQLVGSVPSGLTMVAFLFDVISLGAMVATVVLMFQSVSERWFRTAQDVI